ncbi:hypothetical protein CsSME_00004047 [Camellia sinensis var. sinensis]
MAPLTSHICFARLLFFPPFKTLPIYRRALNPGKQTHSRMIVSGFEPTIFVTNCLMQMYIKCSCLEYARRVFDQMPKRDTVSWNAMIFGYAGSGNMHVAQSIFDSMPERDVVSWNSIISGYVQNGDCRISIHIFLQTERAGIMSDRTTFAVLLKACSGLENYDVGIQVHGLAIHMGFDHDVVIGSVIVDMYPKCKMLDEFDIN